MFLLNTNSSQISEHIMLQRQFENSQLKSHARFVERCISRVWQKKRPVTVILYLFNVICFDVAFKLSLERNVFVDDCSLC